MTASSNRKVRLRDVAEKAGVSLATASRALNGQSDVSQRARAKVLEAARSIGFDTSRFSTKDNGELTVGLLTGDPSGRFSMGILSGAESAFEHRSVGVLLCSTLNDVIREKHYIKSLIERSVDGLIIIGETTNARLSLGSDLPVPVVYAFSASDSPLDTSHVPDDFSGGYKAAQHLISIGRTRIAYIAGPENYLSASQRLAGAEKALAEAGLKLTGQPMFGTWWNQQWGRNAGNILLTQHPDIDAIICGNDQIALGVQYIAQTLNIKVPEDVSLVGFDNWSFFAEEAPVPITSIDLNLEDIGKAAVHALFKAIDSGAEAGLHYHEPSLIIRDSTSPK